MMAVLTAYSASFKSIALARAKIAAVALANEKMEDLRNLPFDDLATQYGPIYPPGNILDSEEVIRKGMPLTVTTVISYVDDPFDGNAEGTIPNKPVDTYPYDYKKTDITVSKTGFNGHLAKLSSNFGAKAAETPSNTGIIKICVVSSTGDSIAEATVTLTNINVDPPVSIIARTGSDGCIMVPNLPPDSHNGYHVSATLNGYSTDSTQPRTAQNPNALQPDLDIIIQQVTNQTLTIDKLGNLTVHIQDDAGNPVANTPIHIEGAKLLYFNPSTPKFSQNYTTDGNGNVALNQIEFDDYTITVDGWTVLSTSPYQPVKLSGDANLTATVNVTHSATLPIITLADPISAITGTTISLTVSGDQFSDTSNLEITKDGHEIVGTDITYAQHAGRKTLTGDFDLTGTATGLWDIILTNIGGESTRQVNGLEITN